MGKNLFHFDQIMVNIGNYRGRCGWVLGTGPKQDVDRNIWEIDQEVRPVKITHPSQPKIFHAYKHVEFHGDSNLRCSSGFFYFIQILEFQIFQRVSSKNSYKLEGIKNRV